MISENYEVLRFFQKSYSKRVHKFFQKSFGLKSNEVPLSINKGGGLAMSVSFRIPKIFKNRFV